MCRGLWSGSLKVPLVRSISLFLLLCSKTAFSIFRCNSIGFCKKNPNMGSSRFKTGNKFWDAERDIMLVSAFVCLFHRRDICCKPEKWNAATIYIYVFFKRHWRVFPKKACWLITRNTRTLWTDAHVSSRSFVRSEITSGLWRVYIFNRKPAWELWSFWKWDNRRQRASIAHPTLIFFLFSPSCESAPELSWSWKTQKGRALFWEDNLWNEDGESLKQKRVGYILTYNMDEPPEVYTEKYTKRSNNLLA